MAARIAAAAGMIAMLTAAGPAMAGAGWSVQTTPTPAGTNALSILLSVSCSSSQACTAVGDHVAGYNRSTVAERWNGTKWAIQRTPPGDQALSAVACPAQRECIAVGGITHPLAELWNGSRWTRQQVPEPAGAGLTILTGLSCTGPAACMAVGSYQSGSTQRPLAERWNGTSWSIQRIAGPTGFAVLAGVSCAGPVSCVAVGTYDARRLQRVYAEIWNGSSWRKQNVPAPAGIPILTNVSCASGSDCVAVGLNVLSRSVTSLADHWNGRSWSLTRVPAPAGEGRGGRLLQGVSCPVASYCIAVGAYSNRANVHRVLTEAWNGTSWAVLTAPDPSGRSSQLQGVFCLSATTCLAVGGYTQRNGSTATLAEHR